MNLSTRKGVNGPVFFSPSIRHFLTGWVYGTQILLFCFKPVEPNAALGFSAASQTVPSDGADLAKDSVHHTAAGISARCSPSPWESKQGRSLIPMEWSQVTGIKQSWICCSGCCWREKSAGAAWLAAGKGMRDVSSPFSRTNSLIWFGFP